MKTKPTPPPPITLEAPRAVDLSRKLTLFKGMDPSLFRGMLMFGPPGHVTHLAGEPVPPTPPRHEQN